ncbi:Spy/CpxP family protein refolding chaperone [Aliarcobacter butzleri]|uniref:Spy/CpxP family protein refolding chaperone n=1 Tax=Aliarcobacter butzleri TaxID=28197 RepID=UPI00344C635E
MKILKIFLLLISFVLILNADNKHKYSYKDLDYLDLNEDQVKVIKKALLDLKKDYKEFYEYKHEQEDILENIIESDNFNEELYYKILMDLKTEATKLEVKRIKKIHEVLNKKQREEFADYLEEWEIE